MAIALASLRSTTALTPPRILLHGVAGIGKTTFAAAAPAPVFLCTEDGLGTLQATHFPLARTFGRLAGAADLAEGLPGERLEGPGAAGLRQRVCRSAGSMAAVPRRPERAARRAWHDRHPDRSHRHQTVRQPRARPVRPLRIKLHARAPALLQEHSNVVLFANYRISTVKSDIGFNKKVTQALGSGERVLYTAERPAFLAKNRYGLPDSLPLSWAAFAEAMPHFRKPRNERIELRGKPGNYLRRHHRRAQQAVRAGAAGTVSGADRQLRDAADQGRPRPVSLAGDRYPRRPLRWAQLFDRLNLINANPTTVEIAQRTLSAICHALGKMQVDDSEQLHLIPLLVDVKVQPSKNGYDASNSIRYLPLERSSSQPAAATPPARSAATVATLVAPQPVARPGGVAPWRRANG